MLVGVVPERLPSKHIAGPHGLSTGSRAWPRARAIAIYYAIGAEVRLVDIARLAYALGLGAVHAFDLPLVIAWSWFERHLAVQPARLDGPVQRLGLEVGIDCTAIHTMHMAISEHNIDHRL